MQRLGVGGQSPNFRLWAQRWEPELDVMDNPSSVITQVSRDEEGSKAAADRGGESPLLSHVKRVTEAEGACNCANMTTENIQTFCVVTVLSNSTLVASGVWAAKLSGFCAARILDGRGPSGPVMKVAEVTSLFWISLVSRKPSTIYLKCWKG